MLLLSIQARQALSKLSLPLFIAASLAVMLVGRADAPVASSVRMAVADALSPIYASVAGPLATVRRAGEDLFGVIDLERENRELRAENNRLRRWYEVAVALEAENAALKDDLHWMPDPAPSFVTGRVVADAGGVYGRSVLVYLGPTASVRRGQIALDATGLVGRVTDVGARSARVLLVTDQASRIPVTLPRIGAHAIMVGTEGPLPRLLYLPDGAKPADGERVVTSSEAGAFPAGLPVGTVRLRAGGAPAVVPAGDLGTLSLVRLFDYKLGAVTPPKADPHALLRTVPSAAPAAEAPASPPPQAAPAE